MGDSLDMDDEFEIGDELLYETSNFWGTPEKDKPICRFGIGTTECLNGAACVNKNHREDIDPWGLHHMTERDILAMKIRLRISGWYDHKEEDDGTAHDVE